MRSRARRTFVFDFGVAADGEAVSHAGEDLEVIHCFVRDEDVFRDTPVFEAECVVDL